jgi:5'-nucleotidase
MAKKILYLDLDNTLVRFDTRLDGIDPAVLAQFEGRYDEIPGLFALMQPMPGAIAAFHTLAKLFDLYILSTAPWGNPSAWQHKIEWVQLHLGYGADGPAYKRLILSHHKNLNVGDYLLDDRPNNGAAQFAGEWLKFGPVDYPQFPNQVELLDWDAAVEYLSVRA